MNRCTRTKKKVIAVRGLDVAAVGRDDVTVADHGESIAIKSAGKRRRVQCHLNQG